MLISAIELLSIFVVLWFVSATRVGRSLRLKRATQAWRWCGRRYWLSVIVCGCAGFAASSSLTWLQLPIPAVHDEFSNLLAADTFYHGRLANETHPMWEHLETIHVIHQPTYASKYPPAQGLVLAAGKHLGGHPVVGVWLWMAMASGATCWMLQGWVPGRWALLGGLIVAFHPDIQLLWGHSYWGGAIAMAGGSLLLGALPRLWQGPRVGPALILAVGVVMLANSRPYEGLVLALLVGLALSWPLWQDRNRFQLKQMLCYTVAPAMPLLLAAAIGMAAYNKSVTGSPWRLPYQVHEATYGATPLFLWQPLPPEPSYRHPVLRDFQLGWARTWHERQRTVGEAVRFKISQAPRLVCFFLTPLLAAPLLLLPVVLRNPRLRFPILVLVVAVFTAAVVPWVEPRYFAVSIPMLWLLIVQGLRHVYVWKGEDNYPGRLAVQLLLVVYLVLFGIRTQEQLSAAEGHWSLQRQKIVRSLDDLPGKHLVVVRYDSDHDTLREWVYNEAEIDAAKIIWAREMTAEKNRQLLEYFRERRVWLLLADESPPELIEHAAR